MNGYAGKLMMPAVKIEALLERIGAEGPLPIAALLEPLQGRERILLYRTLAWLAKMGLVDIRAP